jgi:cytochrome P450
MTSPAETFTALFTALSTPAGRADPYPLYAELHELGEAVQFMPGTVAVHGYDAVNAVLRDPDFRTTDREVFERNYPGWHDEPVLVQGADWILNMNGTRHARIRSLIARAFTARRVAGLEPAIAAIADGLLDDLTRRGADGTTVEFMQDFAYLLPVTVICELIGIPEADRERFRPIARDLAGIFEMSDLAAMPVINAAAVELLEYFTALAAQRRATPCDDLLSDLLAVSDADDGRLTDAELLHNLTLLLVAGFETTTNLLGNGLHIILQDPAAGDAVRAGAVPAAAFVEEVLRFDSPVQLTSREGKKAEVGGVQVADGDAVMVLIGAANRDPRRFARPGAFQPLRADAGPVSFGGGPHFCIGAALARLEGTVAFSRLLARFARIEPAGEPVRRQTFLLRGFDSLPVTIG